MGYAEVSQICLRDRQPTLVLYTIFFWGEKELLETHKLCKDMLVQLWSFKEQGNLWFALVKVGSGKKQDLGEVVE